MCVCLSGCAGAYSRRRGGRERVEDTNGECSGKQDGDGPESKSGDECKDGGLRGLRETFIPDRSTVGLCCNAMALSRCNHMKWVVVPR